MKRKKRCWNHQVFCSFSHMLLLRAGWVGWSDDGDHYFFFFSSLGQRERVPRRHPFGSLSPAQSSGSVLRGAPAWRGPFPYRFRIPHYPFTRRRSSAGQRNPSMLGKPSTVQGVPSHGTGRNRFLFFRYPDSRSSPIQYSGRCRILGMEEVK